MLSTTVRNHLINGMETDQAVLFPTTHLGGMARVWVGSYLAHDPDVQRQLKHCRILADADSPNEVIKKKSQGNIPLQGTWSEDGVNATVLPNDCKSASPSELVLHLTSADQQVRITINGRWLWVQRHTIGYAGNPRNTDMHYRVK